MAHEPGILKALRQQALWPTIHSAVDVYQRRRACNGDFYELIWRLIHIWECTAITLASAAIARLRDLPDHKKEYLSLRERCYGLIWSETEDRLVRSSGALDGSIDKWIEMLQLLSSVDAVGSKYLTTAREFLSATSGRVDIAALVRAWSRACDVPQNISAGEVPVKDALQAVNSFRNRFAHVPFPYDQLEDVWNAMENCTFGMFEVQGPTAAAASCLVGSFARGGSVLRGAGFSKTPEQWSPTECETFVWDGAPRDPEIWDARPFVHLDKMMRPYLLTRLRNEAGLWEYTRYLAEANAVSSVTNPELLKLLPRPEPTEYIARVDELTVSAFGSESPTPRSIRSREEAFSAFRDRDFEPVIAYWTSQVENRPGYHSGWQKLGVAQREYAVDLMESSREKAECLLIESLNSFDRATHHADQQFAAEAFYNRSKSSWRLWQITKQHKHLDQALHDAETASREYYEDRFISWIEFVRNSGATPPKALGAAASC